MKIPTYDKMIWPTLLALKEQGGSASNQELLSRVTEIMSLPEYVQIAPHNNGPQTEVAYRLGWARTYLRKVNAIESGQPGVWSITAQRRSLTDADATTIPAQVRLLDRQSRAPRSETPEEEVGEPDEESWKERLLAVLQAMPPDAFERLSQRVLRESGFVTVEVTGKSGSGRYRRRRCATNQFAVVSSLLPVQAIQGSVGAGVIRDFRGAMVGRSDKGLVITTGNFSPDARREATRDGAPPIDLIDGEQLCEILKKLALGVRTEQVERVIVMPEIFKQFSISQ